MPHTYHLLIFTKISQYQFRNFHFTDEDHEALMKRSVFVVVGDSDLLSAQLCLTPELEVNVLFTGERGTVKNCALSLVGNERPSYFGVGVTFLRPLKSYYKMEAFRNR